MPFGTAKPFSCSSDKCCSENIECSVVLLCKPSATSGWGGGGGGGELYRLEEEKYTNNIHDLLCTS